MRRKRKKRKPPDGGKKGQAMKRLLVFSGIAVSASIAIITDSEILMQNRITAAPFLYYLILLLLESSRDAIVEIRKERKNYGRKRYKAR